MKRVNQINILSAIAALATLTLVHGVFAIEEQAFSVSTQNPFLGNMLKILSVRDLNDSEMSALSAYMARHPGDPEAHLVLSKVYNRRGMDALYADELEKAWRHSPDSLLFLLAALKVHAQNEEQARFDELVEESFSSYSNDSKKLARLGTLFQANNQADLALRFLEKAIQIDPQNRQLQCDYCAALLAQKKYKALLKATEALDSDQRALSLSCLLKGVAYFNLNQVDRALPFLAKAYAERSTDPEVAESYYDALVSAGHQREAVEPALLALAMQPASNSHLDQLKAKIKPVIGSADIDALQAGIKKVSALLPPGKSLAFFYYSVADILDKSGRVLQAANLFNSGLHMYPYGLAYMRLAHDLEIMGTTTPSKIEPLYTQAALMIPGDQEVKARYLRMKARIPAQNNDIALKLKLVFNSQKYKAE